MSTEPRACSREVEALFELGRSCHAPTAADRVRVRNALARRLAEAPRAGPAPAGLGGDTASFTAAKLAALGIGVVCLLTGALALRARVDTKQPVVALGARSSPPPPQRLVEDPVGVLVAPTAPAPASADVASSRARFAARKSSPAAVARPAAEPPGPVKASSVARAQAAAAAPPLAAHPSATVAMPAQSEPPVAAVSPQSATDGQSAETDARAELGFIARIQMALQASESGKALALCAEHERRWPRGTFVQEREGLRAVAACGADARAAAGLASTFLARYPRSPLAARVRRACGAE